MRRAQYSVLTTAIVLSGALQGCGSSFYGQAQPKVETWAVTTLPEASPSTNPHLPTPSARVASVVQWKNIVVGTTTRQDIEIRFGTGKASLGRWLYQVDTMPALIAYNEDQTVHSVRVTPAVVMDEPAFVLAYGKADRERRTDDFLRIWEYDRAGMTVEFASDNATVTSIEYRPPSTAATIATIAGAKMAHSSRPALTDVAQRLASVQTVLSQSATGFSWVGANEEYSQSQQVYSLIHQKWPVVTDRDMQRYLSGVMDRLVAVTPQPPFPWTLRVVDASTLNAMNLGGGVILLNSGLFKHLDSEAQLAFVIAHEMGHQLKRHLASIQTKQQFARLLIEAAALATAGAGHPDAARAINDLGSPAAGATLASFSRTHETEADLIGLQILNAADYDPREAVKVMEKFVELWHLHGTTIPFFSTHPDPDVRLENIQQWLSSMGEIDYEKRLMTTEEFAEFRDMYRY